mmetsp:Transcript_27114/g.36215  ORF Transcript_27114/g.36215 Transcript_27114/m.36215 type:complete len:209 (+) Transcript_27114:123-749(+)
MEMSIALAPDVAPVPVVATRTVWDVEPPAATSALHAPDDTVVDADDVYPAGVDHVSTPSTNSFADAPPSPAESSTSTVNVSERAWQASTSPPLAPPAATTAPVAESVIRNDVSSSYASGVTTTCRSWHTSNPVGSAVTAVSITCASQSLSRLNTWMVARNSCALAHAAPPAGARTVVVASGARRMHGGGTYRDASSLADDPPALLAST